MSQGLLKQLRERYQQRYGVMPFEDSIPLLEQWLESCVGQALLAEEQDCLDHILSDLFGYQLMQLSISRRADLTASSRIQHRFAMSPRDDASAQIQALSDFDSLPLASESIDVTLLHHVLEFSENPHQLLREASRVTIPHGYLVVVGFNPLSLLGLSKPFAQICSQQVHWRYHSLRLARVVDWLRLLDFEPVNIHQGFYRPPIQNHGVMQRLQCMESYGKKRCSPGGGFYMIVARKELSLMTPIKPLWKGFNPIVNLQAGKASSRVTELSVVEK